MIVVLMVVSDMFFCNVLQRIKYSAIRMPSRKPSNMASASIKFQATRAILCTIFIGMSGFEKYLISVGISTGSIELLTLLEYLASGRDHCSLFQMPHLQHDRPQCNMCQLYQEMPPRPSG